jgi:hypothetical protein
LIFLKLEFHHFVFYKYYLSKALTLIASSRYVCPHYEDIILTVILTSLFSATFIAFYIILQSYMSGFSLPMAHITILYGDSYKIDIQITEIIEEYIDRLTWTFILE